MAGSDHKLSTLCVFCGSSTGKHEAYAQAAQALGKELADRKITLIYGGDTLLCSVWLSAHEIAQVNSYTLSFRPARVDLSRRVYRFRFIPFVSSMY